MVPNGFNHVIGLGNFPSDWIVKPADELTSKITKGTTPPKSEIVKKSKTPFLRVNNLGFSGVLKESSEMLFVSKEAHEGFLARSIAYPGDILMNIVGPPLGKISMLDSQFDEYNMNQAIVIYRTESEQVDQYYFLKFLGSELAQQWLQSRSKKTSGQQNLTIQICKELPVPVPPILEQRKIAKILSTWDKAISSTERLIDNNKQQKKALMQQLLTGKKRFPNFTSEWKEIKLADIGKCITGLTYSPDDTVERDGMLVLRSSNVQGGKLAFSDNVFVNPELNVKSKTLEGDILICVRNGSKHLIGKSALIKGRAVGEAHGAFMTLYRCKYPDYVFQLFQTDAYYSQVKKNLGATINSINNSDLHKFKFLIPTDEKERALISECLINADKDIDTLEQQLADLKQEKKALMQQLLTGKRRVQV